MSIFARSFLLAFALFVGPATAADKAPPPKEQKVALVIGNAAYKGSPLANPVNDAKDVAAKLGKLGFDVILKTDVGLRDMSRAVTQFGQKLKDGSVALVYYAGHGIQAKGRNFLVPVDAEIGQEASIRSEAVDVDQVLEQLQPARVSVVILDACRNNPFERRFRGGTSGGLAQMDAPKGTLIAYATAPGKVAMDGEGHNGLYTAELLKALDNPDRRVEDVFKQVRNNVAKSTNDQQIPWESSSLTGDLVLGTSTLAAAAPVVPAATTPTPAPAAFELEFWKSAEKSGKPEDYRAYLAKYPNGQFAELARGRLKPPAPSGAVADSPPIGSGRGSSQLREELERAANLLKAGRATAARVQFKHLAESLPTDSPLRAQAAYGLGLAQAADQLCPDAVKTLEFALSNWPDQPFAPEALRRVSECEKTLGRPFKAQQAAKILLAKYPDSPQAEWVRQQVASRENRPVRQLRQPR